MDLDNNPMYQICPGSLVLHANRWQDSPRQCYSDFYVHQRQSGLWPGNAWFPHNRGAIGKGCIARCPSCLGERQQSCCCAVWRGFYPSQEKAQDRKDRRRRQEWGSSSKDNAWVWTPRFSFFSFKIVSRKNNPISIKHNMVLFSFSELHCLIGMFSWPRIQVCI